MKWSGGPSTPAGCRAKGETPQERSDEEAQLAPRGKRGSAAQWNGLCFKIQQNSECSCLRWLFKYCLTSFYTCIKLFSCSNNFKDQMNRKKAGILMNIIEVN